MPTDRREPPVLPPPPAKLRDVLPEGVVRPPAPNPLSRELLRQILQPARERPVGAPEPRPTPQVPPPVAEAPPPAARPVVVRVADVAPEKVAWLWPGYLPRGKLVVLDGDPGTGKSTLALDLAARVTTGSPMPDGTRPPGAPAAAVLLSAEDGIADTVRPRLEAAGADVGWVYVLDAMPDGAATRPPSIPADLGALEDLVADVGAALVVVDVLNAFLGERVDAYRDQDVRRALHPLAALAGRTGATVVALRHLSKSGGTNAVYRGGGSIGIIGAARVGLLAAPDPQDEGRQVLAVTKSNLAAVPPALAYRLVPDEERDCARVAWEGATAHRAADLLAAPSDEEKGAIAEAADFLRDLLGDGPAKAPDAKSGARAAGIAERTLDHARKKLGVTPRREGFGKGAVYWWELPTSPMLATEPHARQLPEVGEHGDVGEHEAAERVGRAFPGAVVEEPR